ncbi:MAG: hypothetical protein WD669_10865 [Pirellulales bacterium]
MLIRQVCWFAVVVSFVIVMTANCPSASAVGYWNMPGTYWQYFGYGNGPGYHAPLVLGPVRCDGWLGRGVRRMPYAPTACQFSSSGCDNCGAAAASPLFQSSLLP